MSLCPNCFTTKYSSQGYCPMCGFNNAAVRDQRALPVENVLDNRYIVGRVLGIGGFGITYMSYDMQTRERVAVKEYFPSEWATRFQGTTRIVPNSQVQKEFYQHGKKVFISEARILSRLKAVRNVVDVRTMFEENGTAYMVMDYLDGNTLNGFLKTLPNRTLPYTTVNQIIIPVANALQQIHMHNFLHRDVSPDNIIITKKGDIYIIDFGATRTYAINSPKSMSVVLKPGFAPIEQYSRSGNQGPWTDVYALAATYYYLVAGRKPPEATDRIAGVDVIPLKTIAPDVPDYISKSIERALSISWKDRPRSMEAFMAEMGLGSQTPPHDLGSSWKDYPYEPKPQEKKPCVLMQVGQQRQRFYFAPDGTLSIGRSVTPQIGCIRMPAEDRQVSGVHCVLRYIEQSDKFNIKNNSVNKTYTIKGVLVKDDTGSMSTVELYKGDWFYIQTKSNRYIFYLEVE